MSNTISVPSVGVNGKTFHELVGTETVMNYGRGPLHFVVDYLRMVERPMSVHLLNGSASPPPSKRLDVMHALVAVN